MLIIRFDNTTELISRNLLRFYLFREQVDKLKLKNVAKVPLKPSDSQPKVPKFSLYDIALKNFSRKIKIHLKIVESFESKSIPCFLSTFNIKKSVTGTKVKVKNIFKSSGYVIPYVMASLAQMIHFELLNVNTYEEFIKKDEEREALLKEFASSKDKEVSPRATMLVELFIDSIQYDPTGDTFLLYTNKILDSFKDSVPIRVFPKAGITLESLYSILNQFYGTTEIKNTNVKVIFDSNLAESTTKAESEKILKMAKSLVSYVTTFEGLMEDKKNPSIQSFIAVLLNKSYVTTVQPLFLFITTHGLFFIDDIISEEKNMERMKDPEMIYIIAIKNFCRIILDKYDMLKVPVKMIDRDDLKNGAYRLAEKAYKRILHSLSNGAGFWHDENSHKETRELYNYILKKYKETLRSCPVYEKLAKERRIHHDISNEFTMLDLSRDPLNRAQRMINATLEDITNKKNDFTDTIRYNYAYLRRPYLIKVMILSILNPNTKKSLYERDYLSTDFKYSIMKTIFTQKPVNVNSNNAVPEEELITSQQSLQFALKFLSDAKKSETKFETVFEVELLNIYGATFGVLTLNSSSMAFKTTKRKTGEKYRFGSTQYNRYDRYIEKKWLLKDIKEIVTMKYNQVRQAAEIYFKASKSIFLVFFHTQYYKKFTDTMRKYATKKNLPMEIVDKNEMYFALKKYTDQWVECKLSNFQYLMILNKYSGRSFNDISQYPVFPWIISNYTSPSYHLQASSLRSLKYTIGGISPEKREAADSKYSDLLDEEPEEAFQIGSHYMIGRAVLGYLFRLEPYCSIILKFENGPDKPSRMFQKLDHMWENCYTESSNNKELIPEFFYFPEMFVNFNKYVYGRKPLSNDPDVRYCQFQYVDQVIMPEWARDGHHFIEANYTALESVYTSTDLNNWIDFIFGCKQQDPKSYNMFKTICDEEKVMAHINTLNDSSFVEMQEFGINPIKLFKTEHHPSRKSDECSKRLAYSIYFEDNYRNGKSFIFSQMHYFNAPINSIKIIDKYIYFVINDDKIVIAKQPVGKDEPLMTSQFSCKIALHKDLQLEDITTFDCDYQCTRIISNDGTACISCRYYDNSCKMITINAKTKITRHLYFHKTMVTSIAMGIEMETLFSGSQDGTIAMWDISKYGTATPKVLFFSLDHEMDIVSMDYNPDLDLLASGSLDGVVILRIVNKWKFLRLLRITRQEYTIELVRLSPRGYVLVISKVKDKSLLNVYSINGELIASREVLGRINCVIMDEIGYTFITGSDEGLLHKYNLLTLTRCNLIEYVDRRLLNMLMRYIDPTKSVMALQMLVKDGIQTLLIGLNTGELLSIRYPDTK